MTSGSVCFASPDGVGEKIPVTHAITSNLDDASLQVYNSSEHNMLGDGSCESLSITNIEVSYFTNLSVSSIFLDRHIAMRSSYTAAVLAALLVVLPAVVFAQSSSTRGASLTLQFDNRQRTVLDKNKSAKIVAVLAEYVFKVPINQVVPVGSINQSGLLNSQAVVTYRAIGPTFNGKTVLDNCKQNSRSGWFTGSTVSREIKKATDTWWPGDSVKVQKATCS